MARSRDALLRIWWPQYEVCPVFLAPNKTPNLTLIPIWTAISVSLMSPAASDKPSKKLVGPEFGFGAGTVGLKDPVFHLNHPMGYVAPLQAFRRQKY